jgi:hypothetical protein
MPETTTAAARVIANSRNSEPVSPPWNPIGVYERRLDPRLAFPDVPLDVLDHDDRVVHDQPHRQHDREDGEEVQAEAEGVHHRRRPHERHRHRH